MDHDQIMQIILDIGWLTPVEVYRKHGIGYRTQIELSNLVKSYFKKERKNVKHKK